MTAPDQALEAAVLKIRELHQEDHWSAKDIRRGLEEWLARLDAYDGCALVRLEVCAHDRVLLAEVLRALPLMEVQQTDVADKIAAKIC